MNAKNQSHADKLFEEITLRQTRLQIEHTKVDIGSVDFDPDNPRLRYKKELPENTGKSEIDLLFEEEDTKHLKLDIADKGLLEAIYAKRKGERFICVEGNRRTACVKRLHEEYPDNARFALMSARILPPEASDEMCALLMASFHVAGKVKWDAHEKAGHIYYMLKQLLIPKEELKLTLHMGAPAIEQASKSYEIMKDVYKTIDGGRYAHEAEGKWSFFSELTKSKYLKKRMKEHPGFVEKFSRWVGEERIIKAEDVRKLPMILNKGQALHIFENAAPKEAWGLAQAEADVTNPQNVSKFFKALDNVITQGKLAPFQDLQLAGENDTARALLQEAYTSIVSFMERAGVRLPAAPTRRVA
jgi:hypothetical protein